VGARRSVTLFRLGQEAVNLLRTNTGGVRGRRSGNLGAAPSSRNPFTRAEHYIRTRQDVKAAVEGSRRSTNTVVAQVGSCWLP
jgi:hypothetical protein